eukprot:5593889-Karenia_brevis.AAC.1
MYGYKHRFEALPLTVQKNLRACGIDEQSALAAIHLFTEDVDDDLGSLVGQLLPGADSSQSEILRIQLEMLKEAAVAASGVARAMRPRFGFPKTVKTAVGSMSPGHGALPLPSQRPRVGSTRRERK